MKSILIMLALSASAFAQKQDSTSTLKIKHSIGFNFGTTTGNGLAYQLGVNKFSLQIAGHPLIREDQKRYNLALSATYKFRDKKYVDLLKYVAAEYTYQWQVGRDIYYNKISEGTSSKTNVGAGLGFEFDTQNNSKFRLMGGYGAYFATNNNKIIAPTAEISMMYAL